MWKDRPRHAKIGNLNTALFRTEGEYLHILDAALVQSPQCFVVAYEPEPDADAWRLVRRRR